MILGSSRSIDTKSHQCGYELDHPSDSALGRPLHSRGENELGGWSGISGRMKGVVRRAESQGATVGGGRAKEKGRR